MGFPLVEAEAGWQLRRDQTSRYWRAGHRAHSGRAVVIRDGPAGYMSPDVVARFDSVHLEQEGPDRVRVTGARGEPRPRN